MAEAPIFAFKNISIAFGEKRLFSGIEANVNKGDRISLIGRNGSGKSTLLKIIAGGIEPDEGEIFIQPGIKVAYMPQEPREPSVMLPLRRSRRLRHRQRPPQREGGYRFPSVPLTIPSCL